MADRLLVQGHAGGGPQIPVVKLDTGDMTLRFRDSLVRDAQLHDVPEMHADPAVRLVCTLDERYCVLERVDHRKGHQLEDDASAVAGRVAAQLAELVGQLWHGYGRVEEIADLDVPRA